MRNCINYTLVNMKLGVLIFVIVLRITKSDTDCKPSARGEDYRGTLSQTNTGKTCQRWFVIEPHAHNMGPRLPGGATKNANYCRNPDSWNHPDGPWCYTTWANVTWEYCDVTLCLNPQPVASWIFDAENGGADTSFLKKNTISMTNLTYGPGLNGEVNGAIVLPTKPTQHMVVANPTSALRFKIELSFITYVYIVGNTGPLMEYNNWNGNDDYRISLYIGPDSTSLSFLVLANVYGCYQCKTPHRASNVLSQGWHKIGISFTDDEVRTYINGSLVQQSPKPHGNHYVYSTTNDGVIFFGSVPNRDDNPGGRMACAKFYDFALNDEQMASVECKNIACREIFNGRCVGSCFGFYVGLFCDVYLYPLLMQESSISTEILNTKSIKVSWKLSKVPEFEARKNYKFSVRHTKAGLFDFKYSTPLIIGDDATASYVYSYTIANVDRDTEYEISIRSERAVADNKDHHDSETVIVKVPCVAPETPKGLFIIKQKDKFVISWTSNLEALDGGCSSKHIYVYYKLSLSEYWNIDRVDLSSRNYSFPTDSFDDCFAKMLVINNADLESSTAVYTLGNVTLPPPTPSPESNNPSTLHNGNNGPPGDSEISTRPSDGQPYTTGQSVVVGSNTEKQTREGLTELTLILAVCLAVVGVVMLVGIIVATLCWRKNIQHEKDLKSKNTQLENLKVNLATYQAANRKIEYAPYLEPVSSSDDMYHEIDSKNRPVTVRAKQYETLETETKK